MLPAIFRIQFSELYSTGIVDLCPLKNGRKEAGAKHWRSNLFHVGSHFPSASVSDPKRYPIGSSFIILFLK